MLIGRLASALHQEHGAAHPGADVRRRFRASGPDGTPGAPALAAYLVIRLVTRTLDAGATPEVGLVLQRASTLHFLDELPSTDPECVQLRLIVAALGEPAPFAHLRRLLLRYAGWLEGEGRLDQALEVLRLAARTWPGEIPPRDFTELALEVGRINRQLTRLAHADDAYAAAAEGAASTGNRVEQLRAQLGRIAVRRLQGRLAGLEVELQAIAAECERDPSLAALGPLVHADIGALCTARGEPAEAVREMLRAARAASSVPERLHVIAALGRLLVELGESEVATLLLEHVASRAADRMLRATADLERMDLASSAGNRILFERLRAELGAVVWRLPPALRVDFHYRSGTGLSRFGQRARARQSWTTGRLVAIEEQLDDWATLLRGVQEAPAAPPARDAVSPPVLDDLLPLLADARALVEAS